MVTIVIVTWPIRLGQPFCAKLVSYFVVGGSMVALSTIHIGYSLINIYAAHLFLGQGLRPWLC